MDPLTQGVLGYPSIGLIQRDRATEAGWALAAQWGHSPIRLEAGLARHVNYRTRRETSVETLQIFRSMLLDLIPQPREVRRKVSNGQAPGRDHTAP